MEIRFSKPIGSEVGTLYRVSRNAGCEARLTSANGRRVRFTLATDEPGHDRVIRALLTLDPDATVRTARAVYEGLEDFERQFAARR